MTTFQAKDQVKAKEKQKDDISPLLCIATHNQAKLEELRRIVITCIPQLDPHRIISAREIHAPDVKETGTSFVDNAVLKASALCAFTDLPTIADDSGLCVDILGGAPGIFSARWCGKHGDDEANLQLLLHQLADIDDDHRQAHFTCAAVLLCPDGTRHHVIKEVKGRLLRHPRGNGGFGYDPIFLPTGFSHTTAEMSAQEKHRISHRGQAMRALAPAIIDVIKAELRL